MTAMTTAMPSRRTSAARQVGARRTPLLALVALAVAVALVDPPVVAGAEVLGGAPEATAAAPPQTTPEQSEPEALDGLQFGDPAAGIDLVEPPETDSYGSAQLRHPIDIPEGRLGWQPEIALAYASDGGNSWLGQGWDVSLDAIRLPGLGADVSADSISVDTRWGVPRYDDGKESETYLYGGEQLSPNAHQFPQLDREAERLFSKRVEGDYLRIIRHGDAPDNYWWEVHDKIGNKYFYGGELDDYRTTEDSRPDAGNPRNSGRRVPEATLTDADGDIYWWGLREKLDISSNSVTYFYDRRTSSFPGIGDGTELHLSHINYSGSKLRPDLTYGADPPLRPLPRYGRYDVRFVREDGRPDVTSDATGGALHVVAQRLKEIVITFCPQARGTIGPGHPSTEQLLACVEPQLVRRYEMNYDVGPFGKTLLRSVGKADAAGTVFATHTFEYYDEVSSGNGYDGFEGRQDWALSGGGVGDGPLGTLDGSALGASNSLGGDGRLFLGFNPTAASKLISVGGGMQFAGSDGESDLELIDINGDGLPDKVWVEGGRVLYHLNQSGPHGGKAFSNDARPAEGISDLSRDSQFSVGAGAEAYVAAIALMYNHTWTFSKQTTYFSDVNADGRPDLVDSGRVLFNVLEPDGRIWFSEDSSDTKVRLGPSVAIDPGRLLPSQDGIAAEQAGRFPSVDTLRRWVAPWDGTVDVSAPVNLVGASPDGVRVAIEKFTAPVRLPDGSTVPDPGVTVWAEDLPSGDTTVHWPGGVADTPVAIPVRQGDRIYFRVQPGDNGAGDEVAWDPQITYRGQGPRLDVNGKDIYRYSASDDFTLAGRPGSHVGMPFDGTVRFTGEVVKSRPTTDDVTLVITRNDAPVFTLPIKAAETGTFALDHTMQVTGSKDGPNPPETVTPGDRVAMRLAVDTPIDVTAFGWAPLITYLDATDEEGRPVRTVDENNRPMMTIHPPASIDIYPLTDDTVPQDAVELDAGDDQVWWAHLRADDEDVLPARVIASVKNRDGYVAKQEIVVTNAFVPVSAQLEFEAPTDGDYWIDFTFGDPFTPEHVTTSAGNTSDPALGFTFPSGRHWTGASLSREKPDLFPAPYRGWAYAGYNGEGPRATERIHEDDLLFRQSDYPSRDEQAESWDDPNYKNPVNNKGYAFAPDPGTGRWVGPKQSCTESASRPVECPNLSMAKGAIWGGPGRSSTSRIGSDSATVTLQPGDSLPSGGRAPVITGQSDSDSFGIGAGLASFGVGTGVAAGKSQGVVDYLDLNGDAYPDVVGEDVWYTNEVGGLTSNSDWSGDVRLDHSFGQSFDGEGTPVGLPGSATGDTNTNQQAGSESSPTNRAGKGSKGGGPAPQSSGGGSDSGGGPGGKGSGSGGGGDGGGGKKSKKSNSGGSDGGGSGGGDNKTDIGGNLGVSGSLTSTYTNSRDPLKTGLAQLALDENVEEDLADINGDGLPDRVTVDKDGTMEVALNLGYSFAPAREWPRGTSLEEGHSDGESLGISFGFEVDKYGFTGGLSYSHDTERTDYTWDDVNGDGLPDRLHSNGDGDLVVELNTGKGLAQGVRWGRLLEGEISKSESVGIGGGADFTVTVGPLCWPTPLCFIVINPGFHVDKSYSATRVQLSDIDGDGLSDSVASHGSDDLRVARNKTGRTNMLKAVRRPLGATFELQYSREGNTTDHPDSMWVLSQLTVHDGHEGDGVDTQVTRYSYEGAKFDFSEREDFGFRKVVQSEIDPTTDTVYRSYEQIYRNTSYYERGLLESETLSDGSGTPLTSTLNTYDVVDSRDPSLPVALTGHDSLTGSVFPRLAKVEQRWHDAAGAVVKTSEMNHEFDPRGNLFRTIDRGEPSVPDDDVAAEMTFTQCDAGPLANDEYPWTQMPYIMVVRSGNTALQRREANVACDYAAVDEVRDYLTPNGSDPDQVAVTTVEYAPVGGQTSAVIGPGRKPEEGQPDTRYRVDYGWDEVGAVPVRTEDSFGLASTAIWDDRFGRMVSTTSPNQGRSSYTYDLRGRVTSLTGPFEQGGPTPTISYEYHAEADDPWVMARHVDAANPGTTIDTVAFIDGLGREIQTKHDASIAGEAGAPASEQVVVSGAIHFDAFRRAVAEFHPTTEAPGSPGTFHGATDTVSPTVTDYSLLDRPLKVTAPEDRVTTYEHGFDKGPFAATMFTVLETDPGGSRTRTYLDVRENVVGVQQLHKRPSGQQQDLLTRYEYDPLQRLSKVIDPGGKPSDVTYDLLGRRSSVENPDTGKVEFRYDLADNIVAEVTPNLRAVGKEISYRYDRTRLTEIRYPDNPANNVTYAYGAPGAPGNVAGRITRIDDGARTVTRSYDVLGEMVEETAVMKVHNLSPQTAAAHTFTTKFTYDTWGRPMNMTYPDGEVAAYAYDAAGLPRSLAGTKAGHTYRYVDRLEYDKFGNRAFLAFGNGVATRRAFDRATVWLSDQVVTKDQATLQDLHYTYDKAGNVVQRKDSRPLAPPSEKGGPSDQTFTYDDLHRMTSAKGTYSFPPEKQRTYSVDVAFDDAGRVDRKTQVDKVDGKEQKDTTFDNRYEYEAAQSHAPSRVGGRSYTWDADGNLTKWTEDRGGTNRMIRWDEEDRAMSIADQGSTTDYRYDDEDTLTILRTPQGETEYVNDFFTNDNGRVAWKNFFVDDVRVAVKKVLPDDVFEKEQYFLSGDLLDSVNLITDDLGQMFEHLIYLPSGEIWVREHSNVRPEPYLFAGSLYDESRELNLMGARWYEPVEGIFYSADPVLTGDLDAAVEEPRLLGAYGYAFDNPELYVDDSGEQATVNQGAHRAHFGNPAQNRMVWLKATKAQFKADSRPGKFGQKVDRVLKSPVYTQAVDILEASAFELEISYDGGLTLTPKVMGVGLHDFKMKKKKKRRP